MLRAGRGGGAGARARVRSLPCGELRVYCSRMLSQSCLRRCARAPLGARADLCASGSRCDAALTCARDVLPARVDMRSVAIAAVLCGLAGFAAAECANACSGHGDCGTKDQCTCWANWQAADCSERVCQFGYSWVDSGRGDLDHSMSRDSGSGSGNAVQFSNHLEWEKYPTDSSGVFDAQTDEAHFYDECSNKGLCDRSTGTCACYDGYTGSSCQRSTCPNDCSGHGVCRTVLELAAGAKLLSGRETGSYAGYTMWTGVNTAFVYHAWDALKSQACSCDAGWSGPDCTQRECPRGDDPLTTLPADCGGTTCADAQQVRARE